MAGNPLIKPKSDNGTLVILGPWENVGIADANGNIIEKSNNTGASNGRANTLRFSKLGNQYGMATLVDLDTGQPISGTIDLAARAEGNGSSFAGDAYRPDPGGHGDLSSSSTASSSGTGGNTFGGGMVGGVAAPTFVDASGLSADQINYNPISSPNYSQVDPLAYAEQVAAANTQSYLSNMNTAQASALGLIDTDFSGVQQYAPQASQLQQQLVSGENVANQGEIAGANAFNPSQVTAGNEFNRTEKTAALDASGLPVESSINTRLEDAQQRAKGYLPTSVQDRAFMMAARSSAGDDAVSRGLGTSSFTQNAIDKYSISELLQLQAGGRADEASTLAEGVSLLVDSPVKYNPLVTNPLTSNASQSISGIPSLSGSQLAQSESTKLNAMGTITPSTALQSTMNQNLNSANLQGTTDRFNATNDFNAQSTNAARNYVADLEILKQDRLNASAATTFAQNVANVQYQQYAQELAGYNAAVGKTGSSVSKGVSGLSSLIKNVGSLFGNGPSATGNATTGGSGGSYSPSYDYQVAYGNDAAPILSNDDGSIGFDDGSSSFSTSDTYPIMTHDDGTVEYSDGSFSDPFFGAF